MMIQRSIIAVLLVTTWCQSVTMATLLTDPTSGVTNLVDPAGLLQLANGGRGGSALSRRDEEGQEGMEEQQQEGTGIATSSGQQGGGVLDMVNANVGSVLSRRGESDASTATGGGTNDDGAGEDILGEVLLLRRTNLAPEQASTHGPTSVSLLNLRRRDKEGGSDDGSSVLNDGQVHTIHGLGPDDDIPDPDADPDADPNADIDPDADSNTDGQTLDRRGGVLGSSGGKTGSSVSMLNLRRRLLEQVVGQAGQAGSAASSLGLRRRSGLLGGSKLLTGGGDQAAQSGSSVSLVDLRRRAEEGDNSGEQIDAAKGIDQDVATNSDSEGGNAQQGIDQGDNAQQGTQESNQHDKRTIRRRRSQYARRRAD